MKKFFITAIAALALAACSEQVDLTTDTVESIPFPTSKNRSVDEAWNIANQILSQDVTSRSSQRLKPASDIKVVCSETSRARESDTLYYAVDLEDNGGFMLIAAPYNVEPVMAIIDEGSYNDPENLLNLPYMNAIEDMKDYISARIGKNPGDTLDRGELDPRPGIEIPRPAFYYDTIDTKFYFEPTYELSWGQNWPENMCIPGEYPTGCTPLAIAEMLAIKGTLKSISYTAKNIDIANEDIDWNKIRKHKVSKDKDYNYLHCFNCTATDDAHMTLARILREIGYRLNVNYSIAESYAYASNIEPTVKALTGSSAFRRGNGFYELFCDIKLWKRAVIVNGTRLDDNSRGHSWIIDGLRDIHYEVIRYDLTYASDDYIPTTIKKSITSLLHNNWGHSGKCNGWFNYLTIKNTDIINMDEIEAPDYCSMVNIGLRQYKDINYIMY